MRRLVLLVVVMGCVVPCNLHCWGDTSIPSGEYSGTWDLAGSPYIIRGAVTIPEGNSLTIESGVTVYTYGHSSYNILVYGNLLADGASFTGSDTDIKIYNGASADFTNCSVQEAFSITMAAQEQLTTVLDHGHCTSRVLRFP